MVLLDVSEIKIFFYLLFGCFIYLAQKGSQKRLAGSLLLSILTIVFGWTVFKLSPIEMIGFSYAGFKSISLIVEVNRGRIKDLTLLNCLSYILFFPTFVQGPINRPAVFFEDLIQPQPFLARNFHDNVFRFSIGVIKVMLISPLIYQFSFLYLVENEIGVTFLELFIALCMTYLFIYIQFSGISDIAIVVSKCFGFRIIENFNYPLVAQNLNDFWSRWHISLTSFCRDYIYFTTLKIIAKKLGNKYQRLNDAIAIMSTFLTIGLWHGLEQNWLIYGILHGLGVILVTHVFARIWKKLRPKNELLNIVYKSVNSILTFIFISFSLFFIVPIENGLGVLQ